MTSNVEHEIQRLMLERLGIEWTPGEPFYSLIEARLDALRAENERLQELVSTDEAIDKDILRQRLSRAEDKNERLRAALAEMLESFTEPEDDNDILRRARAALGQHV